MCKTCSHSLVSLVIGSNPGNLGLLPCLMPILLQRSRKVPAYSWAFPSCSSEGVQNSKSILSYAYAECFIVTNCWHAATFIYFVLSTDDTEAVKTSLTTYTLYNTDSAIQLSVADLLIYGTDTLLYWVV